MGNLTLTKRALKAKFVIRQKLRMITSFIRANTRYRGNNFELFMYDRLEHNGRRRIKAYKTYVEYGAHAEAKRTKQNLIKLSKEIKGTGYGERSKVVKFVDKNFN